MKLDREVRHKSEDIEDDVLLDVVQAIKRRVRIVSREYDVPYIRAAESLGALTEPLATVIAQGRLREFRASVMQLPISSPSCTSTAPTLAWSRCAKRYRKACLKCSPCRDCDRTRF